MNQESPFRDTIAYILGHEIIYSTQYQSIEFGRSNELLEHLMEKEMGGFAEWLDNNKWFIYMKYQWMKADTEETATTQELVQFYLNRDK